MPLPSASRSAYRETRRASRPCRRVVPCPVQHPTPVIARAQRPADPYGIASTHRPPCQPSGARKAWIGASVCLLAGVTRRPDARRQGGSSLHWLERHQVPTEQLPCRSPSSPSSSNLATAFHRSARDCPAPADKAFEMTHLDAKPRARARAATGAPNRFMPNHTSGQGGSVLAAASLVGLRKARAMGAHDPTTDRDS